MLEYFNLPTEFLNQGGSVVFSGFLGILALSNYLHSGLVVHTTNHSEFDKAKLILVRVSETYDGPCYDCGLLRLDCGILLTHVAQPVLCAFQGFEDESFGAHVGRVVFVAGD